MLWNQHTSHKLTRLPPPCTIIPELIPVGTIIIKKENILLSRSLFVSLVGVRRPGRAQRIRFIYSRVSSLSCLCTLSPFNPTSPTTHVRPNPQMEKKTHWNRIGFRCGYKWSRQNKINTSYLRPLASGTTFDLHRPPADILPSNRNGRRWPTDRDNNCNLILDSLALRFDRPPRGHPLQRRVAASL